jgi:AcrR family transcriptional regulator
MSAASGARRLDRRRDIDTTAGRRLSPDERRKQIIDGAIIYFSDVGFDGGTRPLAERLGITQPLLYRYFPTKEDLIKEVYEHLYVGRWKDEWSDVIVDKSLSLRDRLIRFYTSYTEVIYDPQWIRIYLFAGLKGLEINRWWMQFVEQNIMRRICGEIRQTNDLPPFDVVPLTPQETDAFWMFHGGIFYYGVRREVYQASTGLERSPFIALSVDSLLTGLPAVIRDAVQRK